MIIDLSLLDLYFNLDIDTYRSQHPGGLFPSTTTAQESLNRKIKEWDIDRIFQVLRKVFQNKCNTLYCYLPTRVISIPTPKIIYVPTK